MPLCPRVSESAGGGVPPHAASSHPASRHSDDGGALSCDLPEHVIYLIGEPLSRRDFLSISTASQTFRKVLSAQVKSIKAFPQRRGLCPPNFLPKLFKSFAYSEELILYTDASSNPDDFDTRTLTDILTAAAEHGPKINKLTFLCKVGRDCSRVSSSPPPPPPPSAACPHQRGKT